MKSAPTRFVLQLGLLLGAPAVLGCGPGGSTDPTTLDPDDPAETVAPGAVTATPLVGCETAHDAATPFLQISSAHSGLVPNFTNTFPEEDGWRGEFGAGIALADFDGDGLVDVYLPNRGGPPLLYRNEGGLRFVEVPDAGGALHHPDANGASAADVDNDGDIDLFVMSEGGDQLFLNDGEGFFEDATEALGLTTAARTLAVAWADVDFDGYLDPYTCSFFGAWEDSWEDSASDVFFLNAGGDRLHSASIWLDGSQESSGCMAAIFVDVDRDGLVDLLSVHDKGETFAPDHFFPGTGARTEDLGDQVGLSQQHSGMGLAVADFDGDGALDAWKSSTPSDRLLLSDGASGWYDASEVGGLREGVRELSTWDADAWDIDQDGDEDVLAALAAYGDGGDAVGVNEVWLNDGDARFEFVSGAALGITVADLSRSLARADLDRDGAMDLIVPSADGRLSLYQGRCTGGGVVQVEPVTGRGERWAAGATVEAEIAGVTRVFPVIVGGQVQSSQPPDVSISLVGAPQIDVLRVLYTGGQVVELFDVQPNQHLRIREP